MQGAGQMAESKKRELVFTRRRGVAENKFSVFSFQFSVFSFQFSVFRVQGSGFRVQGSGFRTIGTVDWTGILTTKTQRH